MVIPRITLLTTGIQQTRRHLKNAWFDEERCKLGIERIEGYKKKFNQQANMFIDQPDKSNGCSEFLNGVCRHEQSPYQLWLDKTFLNGVCRHEHH